MRVRAGPGLAPVNLPGRDSSELQVAARLPDRVRKLCRVRRRAGSSWQSCSRETQRPFLLFFFLIISLAISLSLSSVFLSSLSPFPPSLPSLPVPVPVPLPLPLSTARRHQSARRQFFFHLLLWACRYKLTGNYFVQYQNYLLHHIHIY